ncbi:MULTISPECIES: M48 family metallopeptidase [unclassified Massilia]|uniref:M48 family metallopeptidase n=1 Tax=unclassified Massilia TaxID=2609279 RepID=UPI0017873FF4|nr:MULTISPECIES: M48 family metallopeptidase [unclassified Massilia]MBD8532828.1 M48 family metallopeptidase [Massilia sp. CFBP 13647]MBD8676189.1 M48 family metallopeptidase [Massilia sp. CFBP 13721]
MSSLAFSVLFVVFFVLTLGLRFWLANRQIRHVLRHRGRVPGEFAAKVSLETHQKAADYTVAKTRFGIAALLWGGLTLVGFTLLGGLQAISDALLPLAGPGMLHQIALIAAFAITSSLLDLPFDYYRQFVLEERFGFNKMSVKLWIADMLKGALVGAAIGLPLLWVVLKLMESTGSLWWFWTWLVWSGFQLLMMVLYPSVIAPLFNKFTPLSDDSLKARIEGLMARVGFASKGLFVMDGSRRSAHGNAYFSGFGAAKRIVFFDTLIERLAPHEIEAVLAHELGHFKLKHIVKRIAVMFALSLAFLALLGYLKEQSWFYTGLGVMPQLAGPNDAMALLLFVLVLPIFTFVFGPLSAITSRKHEFEADAFAAKHSDAQYLVSALVKMYEDNASTLTPDPLHSAFYDSHPPASVRIAHLNGAAA